MIARPVSLTATQQSIVVRDQERDGHMGVARSICLTEPYFHTAFDKLVLFPASEIFASRADKVRFYGSPDQSIIKM